VKEQVELEVLSQLTKKSAQGKYHTTISPGLVITPKFHDCMLASKYDPKKHTDFPYYSQPKLDGIRCLVSKDGMQSRNGKPIISAPHILEALQPFFEEYPDVVLDGELYNHDLKHDFEKIVSLVRKTKPTAEDLEESKELVQYHIYDCIMDESYEKRLSFILTELTKFFPAASIFVPGTPKWNIELVPTNPIYIEESLDLFLQRYLESGYEGLMLRVPDSPYEGKRSKFLIKHKEFEDEEFEIVSIEEGKGNWAGAAKRIEIRLKDGTTQFSGVRGSLDSLAEVLYNANDYIGTEVTVRYQNKTDDNKLRFPVVVAFWKGKREL
jgi:DNA ligase-1